MGCESKRVGEEEGDSRREVRMRTLAKVVSSTEDGICYDVSFGQVMKLCTSLKKSGCVLAWCLVNATKVSRAQGNSHFQRALFNSGMWHEASRKRQAFPVCEGDYWRNCE